MAVKKYSYRGYYINESTQLNNSQVVKYDFIMFGGSCTINGIELRQGLNIPEALGTFSETQNENEATGKIYDIMWNSANPNTARLYVREKYWVVN